MATATSSLGGYDPYTLVVTYGPLGLMVMGFVTGQLVPGWLYKRSEAENDRLRTLVEDKVLPLVEQTSRVLEQAIVIMDSIDPPRRPPRRRTD